MPRDFDYRPDIPEIRREIYEHGFDEDFKEFVKNIKETNEISDIKEINDAFAKNFVDTLKIFHWAYERLEKQNVHLEVDFKNHPEMKAAMYCPYCNPQGASYTHIELSHLLAGLKLESIIQEKVASLDKLSRNETYIKSGNVRDFYKDEEIRKRMFTSRFASKLFWNSIKIKFLGLLLSWIRSFGFLLKRWKKFREWDESLRNQIKRIYESGMYYDIAGDMDPLITFDMPLDFKDLVKKYDKPGRLYTLDFILHEATHGWPFKNLKVELPAGLTKEEAVEFRSYQCYKHIHDKNSYFASFAKTEQILLFTKLRMAAVQGRGLTKLFNLWKFNAEEDPRLKAAGVERSGADLTNLLEASGTVVRVSQPIVAFLGGIGEATFLLPIGYLSYFTTGVLLNPNQTVGIRARNEYFIKRLKNILLTDYRNWVNESYNAIRNWLQDPYVLCCVIRNLGFLGSNEKWRPWLAALIGILDYLIAKHRISIGFDWMSFDEILFEAYKGLINFYLDQCYGMWSEALKRYYDKLWKRFRDKVKEANYAEGLRCMPLDELLNIAIKGIDNLFNDLMALLKEFLTGFEYQTEQLSRYEKEIFGIRKLQVWRDFLQKLLDALWNYELCYKGSWAERKHEAGWDSPIPKKIKQIETTEIPELPGLEPKVSEFIAPTTDELILFLKNNLGYEFVDETVMKTIDCSLLYHEHDVKKVLDDLTEEFLKDNVNYNAQEDLYGKE